MAAQPKHARIPGKSRAKPVKPGRLPVSEFAFDRAGAGSPFGDDITFPVPVERLAYQHPEPPEQPGPPEHGPPEQPGPPEQRVAPEHAAAPERLVLPEQATAPEPLVPSDLSGRSAEPPAESASRPA